MTLLRALLLTDVVESTKVAEALGDAAMMPLWAAHDRAARDLLPAWRGREIEKTDGLLLLFDSAAEAAGYALAYHRALQALGLPFKARAGLHVGAVTLRENMASDIARGANPSEVEGIAKAIVARIMSVAMGGQTLLSADARQALGATTLRVQSHGHWRLKGLREPFELFEVGDAASPFVPPVDTEKVHRVVRQLDAWWPAREIKHNVPAERDPFVGREEPLRALARKLESGARLVSVLGMGGTGKTRLVTRFARTWIGDFPGGAWFCDLSQARTLDGIYFAVAQALDVPLGKTDPQVQLAHAIAGRGACLMIFDNFEQVARFAEETLGRWLDRARQAKFIVTTREVLGVAGEDTLGLGALPVAEAATLFLRRVEAVRNDYRPSDGDRAVIEELVKVLDGLPLAIELAAARVRVLSPRMLLARMNERFKLLWSTGRRHDRQATLRATFDWSWELLTPTEKAALAQLSVFEGGFTLESAEAVIDLAAAGESPWTVDVVHGLADKSFVRTAGDDRFDLLESVREYAAEHLRSEGRYPGSGPAAAREVQLRHCRHFARRGESAAAAGAADEVNNLVVACRRACEFGDAELAVGALIGAWAALKRRGPFGVAVHLGEAVEALPNLDSRGRTIVDWVVGSAQQMLGQGAAVSRRAEAGLNRSRRDGDRRHEARFLVMLGEQLAAGGDAPGALSALTEARSLAHALEDDDLSCRAMSSQGVLCYDLGRPGEARLHYEAGLAVARAAGDEHWQGGLIGNLGNLMFGEGELEQAQAQYEQCLALARRTGDRRWEGNMRCNLGLLHHEQGRSREARIEFEEALAMARAMGHARLECTVLCNLGIVLEAIGEPAVARQRYEEAVHLASDLADRRSEGQFRGYLGLLLARAGHAEAGLRCLGVGERLLVEASDELSLGLLLCRKGEAEYRSGRAADAAYALSRVEAIVARAQATPRSELGKALALLSRTLTAGAREQEQK